MANAGAGYAGESRNSRYSIFKGGKPVTFFGKGYLWLEKPGEPLQLKPLWVDELEFWDCCGRPKALY